MSASERGEDAAAIWYVFLDNCEVCLGTRGGMLGNENRIDGTVCCDDCSVPCRCEHPKPVKPCPNPEFAWCSCKGFIGVLPAIPRAA